MNSSYWFVRIQINLIISPWNIIGWTRQRTKIDCNRSRRKWRRRVHINYRKQNLPMERSWRGATHIAVSDEFSGRSYRWVPSSSNVFLESCFPIRFPYVWSFILQYDGYGLHNKLLPCSNKWTPSMIWIICDVDLTIIGISPNQTVHISTCMISMTVWIIHYYYLYFRCPVTFVNLNKYDDTYNPLNGAAFRPLNMAWLDPHNR